MGQITDLEKRVAQLEKVVADQDKFINTLKSLIPESELAAALAENEVAIDEVDGDALTDNLLDGEKVADAPVAEDLPEDQPNVPFVLTTGNPDAVSVNLSVSVDEEQPKEEDTNATNG